MLDLQVRDVARSRADYQRLQDSKAQGQIYTHPKRPAMGLGGYQDAATIPKGSAEQRGELLG